MQIFNVVRDKGVFFDEIKSIKLESILKFSLNIASFLPVTDFSV